MGESDNSDGDSDVKGGVTQLKRLLPSQPQFALLDITVTFGGMWWSKRGFTASYGVMVRVSSRIFFLGGG